MPEILPDLSEVDSTNIEPGVYPARITVALPGTSKAGNAKVDVTFEVDVGEGRKRTRNTSVPISGKGAFRWTQLLRATGFSDLAGRMEKGERIPFNTDNLHDQDLQVEIGPGQARTDGEGFFDEIKRFIKA